MQTPIGDPLSRLISTMASFSCYVSLFLFFLHFLPALTQGDDGKLIYEDGYTVTTVLDGDKANLKVNPYSIHHRSPSSDLFILLDSAASTFYTVSLPSTSNETVVKKLTGNLEPGYLDGSLDSARFSKPKSFTIDYYGNVYVADQRRRSIRKITNTGVTTIAGGSSQKAGRKDGDGRDALFSDDFELTFIPQRCALMISDHGNRLIRQIKLKEEDCRRHSRSLLGSTSSWILGIGLSSLLGLIVGLVIRPYLIPYEGHKPPQSAWTWTCYLMNLERQMAMLYYGIKSAVVNLATVLSLSRQMILLNLSYLSLISSPCTVKSGRTCEKAVSLMDMDEHCSYNSVANVMESLGAGVELKDLLTSDGGEIVPANGFEEEENVDNSLDKRSKIDDMIRGNLVSFDKQALEARRCESVECGLVKRR